MKDLRVALISRTPFPVGPVSTIRYSTYCKAFARYGVYTKVYVLHPSKSLEAKLHKETVGVFDEIEFEYISSSTYWSESLSVYIKQIIYLINVIKSLFSLKRDNISVIILYHHDLYSVLVYRVFCSIFRINFITDKTEYPYFFKSYGRLKKFIKKIELSMFDRYLVMTRELFDFYSYFLKKNKDKFFHLPMTIDISRFDNILNEESIEPYIACTFGVHNRDSVIDTLKAYYIYKNNVTEPWNLFLFGNFDALENSKELIYFIESHKIKNLVKIKGLLSSNEIPYQLVNSMCLITTAREYTSGGFPTKLGEYLATRKPVVCTAAGEIPIYLEDEISAYLAKPGDIDEIAKKLICVHENYDNALRVAAMGYRVAETEFNANNKVFKILEFIS
ncbi:MAG: glycosyltransferase [Desulfuromonadales bacterium]|nr:glycosyltransferase [Desulfuromonadales bacterium]